MAPKETVVDMEHLSFADSLSVASQERFAMPPVVVAALRQAASKATIRLLRMMEDDEAFEKLTHKEKMDVIDRVMDRAYGRSETASSSLQLLAKAGQLNGGGGNDQGQELDAIEERMSKRNQNFPEMRSITHDAASAPAEVREKSAQVVEPMDPPKSSNVEDIAEAARLRNERRANKGVA